MGDGRKRVPSPFEERVYAVVRRIPKGEVRTYRWVAKQLGDAALARAVGNALNRNPYAPEVPCHRVIRSDGSLGGFARGSAAKRSLLRREGWPPG
jgi:O-6-methylguanine DNA methyltransferase